MMVSRAELRRFILQLPKLPQFKLDAIRKDCVELESKDEAAKELREAIDQEIQRRENRIPE